MSKRAKKFEPCVIYDKELKRFILYLQHPRLNYASCFDVTMAVNIGIDIGKFIAGSEDETTTELINI